MTFSPRPEIKHTHKAWRRQHQALLELAFFHRTSIPITILTNLLLADLGLDRRRTPNPDLYKAKSLIAGCLCSCSMPPGLMSSFEDTWMSPAVDFQTTLHAFVSRSF
jgi:hypothetical protein